MDPQLRNLLVAAPENITAEARAVLDAVDTFESAVHRVAHRLRCHSNDSFETERPEIVTLGEILECENEHEVLAADAVGYIGTPAEKRRRLMTRAAAIHGCAARLDQIARGE